MRNIKKIFSIVILTCNIQFAFPQKVNEVYTPIENSVPENSKVKQTNIVPNYTILNVDRTQQNIETIMREVEQHQMLRKQHESLETEKYYDANYLKIRAIENNYWNALTGIKEMLAGNQPLDLKKAVYLVEHAFLPSLTYSDFDNKIQQLVEICRLKMEQENLDMTNPLAINLAIQKIMSDTVEVKMTGQEQTIKHYPFIYDFDDAWGEKDHANQFVSKLLYTKSGQCHSLPLLYLILAQELNSEAYLAFAPHHSYIKFKDESGKFYNYETTSGYLISDNALMRSGFITAEAIKNKVFLDTLSKTETIGYCLSDLAQGYFHLLGFGNGEFLKEATDLSLKYFPDRNLRAYMIKSNLSQAIFLSEAKKNGVKSFEEAMQNIELKKLWDIHDGYYRLVQDKGYSEITKETYLNWVKSIQELNSKMTNEEIYTHLKNELKRYEN